MSKEKVALKKFRAVITIEFDAPDRETAVKRTKEQFDNPHAKVRVQEQAVSWLTLPDSQPA